MLIDIYNKINKFFELVKPYKKIEESLKKEGNDGELFPIKKPNESKIEGEYTALNENLHNLKEETAYKKITGEEKRKNNEQRNEKINENKPQQVSILNNFAENIKNFYTARNEFFNFENTNKAAFSYVPPNITNNNIQNFSNEFNSQNTTSKVAINEFNTVQKEINSNATIFEEKNGIFNMEDFGKLLAEALKNAAKNKTIAGKY